MNCTALSYSSKVQLQIINIKKRDQIFSFVNFWKSRTSERGVQDAIKHLCSIISRFKVYFYWWLCHLYFLAWVIFISFEPSTFCSHVIFILARVIFISFLLNHLHFVVMLSLFSGLSHLHFILCWIIFILWSCHLWTKFWDSNLLAV